MPNGFGNVPAPPAFRAPGGFATDISGGLAAFAENMRAAQAAQAAEAFRQAQLKLQEDELRQRASEGAADRDLRRELAQLQAEIERERNQRMREKEDRDQNAAREAAGRDFRTTFDRQLDERREAKAANALRRMMALSEKGVDNLTPAEAQELKEVQQTVALSQMKVLPEANRADSLAAFGSAQAAATGPLSSDAAADFLKSTGLGEPPKPRAATPSMRQEIEVNAREALTMGVPYGRIIAKVRSKIQEGVWPPEAEQWVAEVIRASRSAPSPTPAPDTLKVPSQIPGMGGSVR